MLGILIIRQSIDWLSLLSKKMFLEYFYLYAFDFIEKMYIIFYLSLKEALSCSSLSTSRMDEIMYIDWIFNVSASLYFFHHVTKINFKIIYRALGDEEIKFKIFFDK